MTIKALLYVEQNYSFAILRPIQQELLRRGYEPRWFLVGAGANSSYLAADEYLFESVNEVIAWCPDVVFVPGDMISNVIPGLKVSVFHGFNAGKKNWRGKETHFYVRGCFDLCCTHGPNNTHEFQRLALRHKYFTVEETGWPMLDPLFDPEIKAAYQFENDRPTVLYCSTFSPRYSSAPHLYDQVTELARRRDWNWLIQFHPMMPTEIVSRYKAFAESIENVRFVETDNVIPLLKSADVMLCDTSSVMLMFLLQRRPVVTYKNESGGAHLANFDEPDRLEEMLEPVVSGTANNIDAIEQFCQSLHPTADGRASERVVDAAIARLQNSAGLKSKPRNFIRERKERKKLNYQGGAK